MKLHLWSNKRQSLVSFHANGAWINISETRNGVECPLYHTDTLIGPWYDEGHIAIMHALESLQDAVDAVLTKV